MSHSTLPNAADDSVLNFGYETTPYEYYGSHKSSAPSSASSISIDSFEFDLCEEFNADSDSLTPPSDDTSSPTFEIEPHSDYDFPSTLNSTDASGVSPDINPFFLMLPGMFNLPVSGTNPGPYDFTPPKPSNSADASPVTASRTWDTAAGATWEGPRYLNSPSRPYDDAAHDPSNASLSPHVSGTTSTAYGGALGNFCTVKRIRPSTTHRKSKVCPPWLLSEISSFTEVQGANSSAGHWDARADIIVPKENNNTDNGELINKLISKMKVNYY